jgi:alkylation response protein AidB-like acyl-CoA dehydrogenase
MSGCAPHWGRIIGSTGLVSHRVFSIFSFPLDVELRRSRPPVYGLARLLVLDLSGYLSMLMFGLSFTADEERFRSELRAWLGANLPAEAVPDDEDARRDFQRAWQRTLAAAGYVGIQWPKQYGGRGATLNEQIIFTEEMARVRAPEILDAVAVNIVGSVLIHAGTPAQQQRYLPRILPADEIWCLGFSEPNAGSDLASLRTRAVLDGDSWVVSGQKVWSSKAHFADWLLLLVRTDVDVAKHKGITCMIVDMHAPGVTWRPLVQISGRREFNEVFLEDVRVPVANTVGAVNGGWPLIRAALAHERGTLWAFDFKIRLQTGSLALEDLYRKAKTGAPGRGADLTTLREQVAQAHIESEVFAAHTLRILPKLASGDAGNDAALQKLFGSEIQQRACELAMQLEGAYAQLAVGDGRGIEQGAWQERYLYSRSTTISSGTSEVLRNLLAQQALGLPR